MILAFLAAIGLLPSHAVDMAPPRVMLATTFDVASIDPGNPRDELACAPGHHLDRVTPVVAHRTLPCGARLLLYAPRTGRTVIATVADRGPFGKNRDGIDLNHAAARALRSNGWESVVVVQLAGRAPNVRSVR